MMKFSIPGHSCIQDVDQIQSNIENATKLFEVWSPVSLIKVILSANKHSLYNIIQMKQSFSLLLFTVKNFGYSKVPYTHVAQLKFVQSYKRSHAYESWKKCH